MQQPDKELDARGLLCPLPILRTKQSLAVMMSGQTLRIVATDPGEAKNIAAEHPEMVRELSDLLAKARSENQTRP